MCYFNGIRVTKDEYIRLLNLEKSLAHLEHLLRPVQDAFAFQESIILKANSTKTDFDLVGMEWGFLPKHVKNRAEADRFRKGYKNAEGKFIKYDTQNAKGEELLYKGKMYREAALTNRCLLLISVYEEWRHLPKIGAKGQALTTTESYPYCVYIKDKPYILVAAIYNTWTDRETGEMIDTYSLITTAANPLMKIIHNKKERMPTILTEELAWEWLFGELSEERITQIATFQFPYEQMRIYTLDKNFKTSADPLKYVKQPRVPEVIIDGVIYDEPPEGIACEDEALPGLTLF
ncbi:SOS response-associated peptidase [Chitinophaga rhizophila]|uniref:Abasic site processing protein n=1 Tax=Chitinophaga rhizophila TaxID=2866212 RepID=A0ABS7G779_9BACT|nr:SOS response-associated peptidase family protein [Chitinophaga rhizophila]MBW8683512.1 SOS response-associated peptidase [Chitinophaga rhizophila]